MRISRRKFVNSAAAGIAGAAAATRISGAQSKPVAPSDQISLAFIGVGGMGTQQSRVHSASSPRCACRPSAMSGTSTCRTR